MKNAWWPLDGCCYFLVASGWLLLMGSGWSLIFPGGLWMVVVPLVFPLCVDTVALLVANVVADLRPQQRPWAQQNDPCLCGETKISATIHRVPGNNSHHPEAIRKYQQPSRGHKEITVAIH